MTVTHDLFSRVEAMRQESAEREAAKVEARRKEAEDNRRRMPTVSGWVERCRKVFGADLRVAYACEGGVTIGQPSPAGMRPCVSATYVPRVKGRT